MSDGYARKRYRRQFYPENGEVARQRSWLLVLILAGLAVTVIPLLFFTLNGFS
jgi:hypothetical protein